MIKTEGKIRNQEEKAENVTERSSGFDGSEARASFKAANESFCSRNCSSSWFSRALSSSSSAIAATILRDQGRRPDTDVFRTLQLRHLYRMIDMSSFFYIFLKTLIYHDGPIV